MDAEEILMNLDKVHAYFQPIFSADEHLVTGYEIQGCFETDAGMISLRPFLEDRSIPEEYRLEVDNHLLVMALQKFKEENEECMIYINKDPDLLMLDHGEEFFETIKKHLEPKDFHRIVIVLSESSYTGSLKSLNHLLVYYKTYGIKIAIDHLGEESHLDRIAQISPQILKVDISKLHASDNESFKIILYSLSLLARKIGASLHFENISMSHQLRFAWKNGGRYYEGPYLAEAGADFVAKDIFKDSFKKESQGFITSEKKKLENLYEKTRQYNEGLLNLLNKYKRYVTYPELLQVLGADLEKMCFRLYVCDEQGYQKSPNVFQKEGKWIIQDEYLGKNWSWRPYFLENILIMRNENKGILSDLYSDIESGELIRTFSFPLNNSDYLFIDLAYAYLYENDVLL